MMGKKILLVNDGIIAIVSEDFSNREKVGNSEIKLALADFGATLTLEGYQFCLPSDVLTHLEKTDGANIYFYESSPYDLIAEYQGCISLDRDEILKLKGALEYSQRL
ncbi:hypothetical protein KI809_02395 [Geobacter pelophilus]|uniref:Uncharacterized protein n=1 Tax=Geoanaerobacter pelophilus TaxID=60036 RepID=A0AAW4KWQ3_9BACT|nr:hypothetical protein [Geoanaerobacter pelophilus]MBT0663139.1 hypothetical protein [Geoanaerobacter pelophilus]